jgi:hypothetical protein
MSEQDKSAIAQLAVLIYRSKEGMDLTMEQAVAKAKDAYELAKGYLV